MIEKIEHNGEVIAVIVYKGYHNEGISFITSKESILQLGYISHPAGYQVKAHAHKPVFRHTTGTQEMLFIKSGVIKIDFYTTDKAYLKSRELSAGDIVLLAGGGHGITMLETASIIEIKNGPYIEDADKDRFEEGPV
jgi:hypothetical protein